MPLYEVTVESVISGQQAIWRSQWEQTSIPPGGSLPAYRLLEALGYDETDPLTPTVDSVLEAYQNCAIGSAGVRSLFARNIFDPLDFYEIPLATQWVGAQSGGAYMPPFVNAQWRSNRTNLEVRRGHVSTLGVQEANVDDSSNVIGVDLTGPMEDFATHMSAPVTRTLGIQVFTFRSCILSKLRYMVAGSGTDPVTNPARWAYKYYPTEAEQIEHAAFNLTWTRMIPVSSRNSRKVGRGR